MIEISVIICTYNRAEYLKKTLESCLSQSLQQDRFEVNIIDNASTDNTKELVRKWQASAPNVRYFYEPEQGLNKARTLGANVARGRYVAYIDSDAYAEKYWLFSLLDAFCKNDPKPMCVGGRIFLDWQGERPVFYPHEYDSLHCHLDFGERGFFLQHGGYLIGTNVAFNRDLILQLGGFRTYFGRNKGGLISGAETEMINRILELKMPVYYEPKAQVWHRVIPERKTMRFLIKRVYADGATQPLIDLDSPNFENVFRPKRILYDLKLATIYFLQGFWFLAFDQKKSLHCFLKSIQRIGRVKTESKFIYHRDFIAMRKTRQSSIIKK